MNDPASGLWLLRVRIAGFPLGPGKANLLAAIAETGSIAAAGRRLKMSYRRAWSLTEELNAAFAEPLVLSARGGATGGGASLTPSGVAVLAAYRNMERATADAIAADIADLERLTAHASNAGSKGTGIDTKRETTKEGVASQAARDMFGQT